MKIVHITATVKQEITPSAGWVSTIARNYVDNQAFAEVEIWQVVPSLLEVKYINGKDGIKYVFYPGDIANLNYAESATLLEQFHWQSYQDCVFHIHGQLRAVAYEFVCLYGELVDVVFSFWGPINTKQLEWKDDRVNYIKCVTYCNPYRLEEFRKSYRGALKELTVGVDTTFFMPLDRDEARRLLNIHYDRFVMVMVARFIPWKQIIEFINEINKIEKDYLLMLVGDGPLKNEIETAGKNLIDKGKLRLLGVLPRESEQMRTTLNASNLFVTVSEGEGASGAVMEALACGLPVFSTNFGGTVGFLKRTGSGLVVDTKDFDSWRFNLEKIIDGELKVNVAALKDVNEVYAWSSVCKRLRLIYNEASRNISNGY